MPWTCGLGDEAVVGGRGDEGLALGKALQGMAGNCANPPSHSLSGSSCLSLPAHVSAAWSCPCRELFLCPQVSSLSVLTDPIPAAVCSALPCRPLLAAGHCPGAAQWLQALMGTSDQP